MGQKQIALVLVAATGLLLTILLFSLAQRWEEQNFDNAFKEHSKDLISSLERHLRSDVELLLDLRSFYRHADFSRSVFSSFSAELLIRHDEIKALEWIPRVPHELREQFEADARADGFPSFVFSEKGSDGEMVGASRRDEYFPVYFVEPLTGNEAAQGFDLASNPVRKEALFKSRDSGEPVVSEPIKLVQETGDQQAVLLFLPVYKKQGVPTSIKLRRQELEGFMLAVLRLKDILEKSFGQTQAFGNEYLEIRVTDITEVNIKQIYKLSYPDVVEERDYAQIIDFAGREWQLSFRPTGSLTAHHMTIQPVLILAGGMLLTSVLCLYIFRQIRQREDAQALVNTQTQELQRSEAKALAIMEGAINPIIVIDDQGIVMKYNHAAEKLFGYSATEMVGHDVNKLMSEPHHSSHGRYIKNYLETGEAQIIGKGRDVVARRNDGTDVPIHLGVTSVKEGDEQFFVGMMIDLTERKKIEQYKSEFVSTVSHELRTPLTAINGALRLVSGGAVGDIPKQSAELLDMAQRNTDRLLLMVNELLDFQKLDSGRMSFSLKHEDLGALVKNTVAMTQGYADEFGVSFNIEALPENVLVNVDSNRLSQVLANLLSNAVKFSPKGAEVGVSLVCDGQRAVVSVTDKGPGIPEAFHSSIFTRFSQADASDTRSISGTGLGLAISKMIIEQMDGEIGFESEEGKGARFYFELDAMKG